MKRPPDVLEKNLARLLSRSYRPARPRETFRRELKARLLAPPANAAAARPRVGLAPMLLAAAALLLVTTGIWWGLDGTKTGSDPDALVARGDVALRFAPRGPWEIAEAERYLLVDDPFVEVRTPADRSFRLETSGGELLLGGGGHLATAAAAATTSRSFEAWLWTGQVELRHRVPDTADRWNLVTSEGTLVLGAAELLARYEGDSVWLELGAGGAAWLRDDEGDLEPLGVVTPLRLRNGEVTPWSAPPTPTDVVRREPPTPPDEDRTPPITVPTPLAVPPGIRVRAVDARSGEPVPDFQALLLRVEQENGELAYGVQPRSATGVDGTALFTDVAAGSCRVFVESSTHASWRSDLLRLATAPAGAPIEVRAELEPEVVLTGRVVDATTGSPVAGALVFDQESSPHLLVPIQLAYLERMVGRPRRAVETDAQGRFELRGVGMVRVVLRAARDGFVPAFSTVEDPRAQAAQGELRLELTPGGGGIEGVVLGDDGRPAPNAMILAIDQSLPQRANGRPVGVGLANEGGAYRIPNLPTGVYIVLAMGRTAAERAAVPRMKPTHVYSSGFSRVDFGAGAAGATVRWVGVLRDAAGIPLPGKTLSIVPAGENLESSDDWAGALTDDDGVFRVEPIAPGIHDVFLIEGSGEVLTRIARVDVGETADFERDVQLAGRTVTGRAVVAATGLPPEGNGSLAILAGLAPGGGGDQFAGKMQLTPDGRFRFDNVVPGRYVVAIYAADSSLAHAKSDPFFVTDAAPAPDVTVRLFPGGIVRVRARTADGVSRPVPVRLVDTLGVEFDRDWSPRTDEAGELVFRNVAAGRWSVVIDDPGFQLVRRDVVVRPLESTQVEVTLIPRD